MSDFTYEIPIEDDFFNTLIEFFEHENYTEIVELLKKVYNII